ncbi:uncharacterized protein LOC116347238 [Contarinia nasturtii]|uniref:uncharacterized protein LOC116347238 n=1 Tax=Contarinia nasturtii TaxID=265458 RepID=UPI0012D3AA9F|nr:uncharacterized protein LOC116347238 [Contarinia nasturtii]XP_031633625.1 uncharacterized protein LOC116347238 [Contarinia nasturtii]
MAKTQSKHSEWKFCSKEIGWLGIGLNVLCLILFRGIESNILSYATICTFILNAIASTVWLMGVALNRPELMALTLICWAIELFIWIFFIVILAIPGLLLIGNDSDRENIFSIFSVAMFILVFSLIYFYYAVKSYQKLKVVIEQNRLNVAYSVASAEIDIDYKELKFDQNV